MAKLASQLTLSIEPSGDGDTLPNQKHPRGTHFHHEPGSPRPRQCASVPRRPIHEKQNVARFLLHDGLKGVDEFLREVARAARDFEQAKSEETIDALAIAGDQPSPLGALGSHIGGLWLQRNSIGLHQLRQYHFVAGLFGSVHSEGRMQQRIADRVRKSLGANRRSALGVHGDVPNRQFRDPLQGLRRQGRPRNHGGFVRIVGLQQHLTGLLAVRASWLGHT
jgi:hypothetical protein